MIFLTSAKARRYVPEKSRTLRTLAGFAHGSKIVARDDEWRAALAFLELCDGAQRRLLARALEIGAREAVGGLRQHLDVHVRRQRHVAAAEPQDGRAIGRVGFPHAN